MAVLPPNTSTEFSDYFHLSENGWTNIVLFAESTGYRGFSATRPYPEGTAFKPAIRRDGAPDTVVMVRCGIRVADLDPGRPDIPIWLSAGKHSLYLRRHLDFDYEGTTQDSPTFQSAIESDKSRQPVDLRFDDDFCLDLAGTELTFRTKETNVSIEPAALIHTAYQRHTDTLHLLNTDRIGVVGRKARFRTWDTCIALAKGTMKHLLGFKVQEPTGSIGWTEPYTWDHVQRHAPDSIELFGYKASKRSIIYFSVIAIGMYALFRTAEIDYSILKSIFSNPFLSVCGAVVLLWIIDDLIPRLILLALNRFIKWRSDAI